MGGLKIADRSLGEKPRTEICEIYKEHSNIHNRHTFLLPMTELHITLSSANTHVETSIIVEGGGKVLLCCDTVSSSDMRMDVDINSTVSISDCGCGDNQLAHYESDGAVRQDLPERCRRFVNGHIGSTATHEGKIFHELV